MLIWTSPTVNFDGNDAVMGVDYTGCSHRERLGAATVASTVAAAGGATFRNSVRYASHCARIIRARGLPLLWKCFCINLRSTRSSIVLSPLTATISSLQCDSSVLRSSSTYAMPLDIPAAKFLPTDPSTTTTPPVMYSQQWSPAPSTTATAPEFRTAKRSPALPAAKSQPLVAPYKAVLPRTTGAPAPPPGGGAAARNGRMAISPPHSPL